MTDADKATLARELIRDEGTGPIIKDRLMPYEDSLGYLTLGFGRCIELRGISMEEAHYLLMSDIKDVLEEMDQLFPWASEMNGTRQRVLANMLFNLGATKLAKFKNTLHAMAKGQYQHAADGMRASLWAKQTGKRAQRLATLMEVGHDA